MNINYPLVVLVLLIALIILFVFLRRNSKDKKEFGKKLNATELGPDKHEENESV